MKYIFYFIGTFLLFQCKTAEKVQKSSPLTPESISVQAIFTKCKPTDTLWLYRFEGIHFKKLQAAKVKGDTFHFSLPVSDPQFYYVGTSETNKKSILVGKEALVQLSGECSRLQFASVEGTGVNQRYTSLTEVTKVLKADMNKAVRNYQQQRRNPEAAAKAAEGIAKVDHRKMALLDSLKRTEPLMAKIFSLESFESFVTDQKGHNNEIVHFASEYFSGVDLKDPFYNGLPQLFEAFRSYSQTLASTNMPLTEMKTFIDSTLQDIPEGARANRYALGGVVMGLQARNHPAFLTYGKQFVDLYKGDNAPAINNLAKQVESAGKLAKGEVAPDFTQNTPEGTPLTLSSLRGKVILIDFWASWCGPCRKENPNVVRLYNQYKDKGFDILGVSLDRAKDRWVKAIEKDGLPWHHVSDLRGWSNVVAQTYGVRSIPHTVLLDREGRIIARNLKGAQLEYQVDQLLKSEE